MTGRLVAEALPRVQRLRLIARLHEHGLTDDQIADVTAYSTYTTARIRSSLGLAPNENGVTADGVVQGRRRAPRAPQGAPSRS